MSLNEIANAQERRNTVALHVSRAHRAALGTLLSAPPGDRHSTLRDLAETMHTPAPALLLRLLDLATPAQRADLKRNL